MFDFKNFFDPIKESFSKIGLHLAAILSVEAEQKLLTPQELEVVLQFEELVGTEPLENCRLLKNKGGEVIGYSFERYNRRYDIWFNYHIPAGSGWGMSMPMRVFSLDVTELSCGHVVLKLHDTLSTRYLFLRLEGRFEAEKSAKKDP